LLSESNQTIKELFSESNGSKLLLIPSFVNNHKTIGDLSVCCPSNNKLRFPSKATDFLDFLRSWSETWPRASSREETYHNISNRN